MRREGARGHRAGRAPRGEGGGRRRLHAHHHPAGPAGSARHRGQRSESPGRRRDRPAGEPAPARAVNPLGAVGLGDLEARERRARRRALDALVDELPDEHGRILHTVRADAGLAGDDDQAQGTSTDPKERRARRRALDELVEAHDARFEELLSGFRAEEGLRTRTAPSRPAAAADDEAAEELAAAETEAVVEVVETDEVEARA